MCIIFFRRLLSRQLRRGQLDESNELSEFGLLQEYYCGQPLPVDRRRVKHRAHRTTALPDRVEYYALSDEGDRLRTVVRGYQSVQLFERRITGREGPNGVSGESKSNRERENKRSRASTVAIRDGAKLQNRKPQRYTCEPPQCVTLHARISEIRQSEVRKLCESGQPHARVAAGCAFDEARQGAGAGHGLQIRERRVQ